MKQRTPITTNLAALLLIALVAAACSIPIGLKKEPTELDHHGTAPERTPIYHEGDWIVARASLHNHTLYSDGCRTPEDLLELARQQGIAVLAVTDHRENKICLGKHGVVCAEIGGVERVGYADYFKHIHALDEQAKDNGMIVLKGVEVIPYYYNYGKFPALVVDGAQWHFVEYTLTDPDALDNMPTKDRVSLSPEPIPGMTPLDNLVNYLDDHGAIVHSVHPEDGADLWIGPLHGADPPPLYNPFMLRGLTGFSVLPSGWQKVGAPGGLWDSALIEYLYGRRDRPLWANADADYHGPSQSLVWSTTLLYMREFSEADAYACLREGRMVALQGDAFQDTYVSEWWVSDGGAPEDRIMLGREVKIDGAPTVHFALDHPVEGIKVRLVRNGQVVAETADSELTFKDDEIGAAREPAYYRVEVVGPRAEEIPETAVFELGASGKGDTGPTHPASELFVNPIFVRY